jgi:hypothetical protein
MNQFQPLPSHSACGNYLALLRSKNLVALLLLVVWMPATMCCALERAGVPFFQQCCEDDAADGSHKDPCGDKTCCLLESGKYQTPNPTPLLISPEFLLSFVYVAFVEPPEASLSSFEPPESSPPDLPVTWQFSSRAALPVRAPSIAS